MPVNVTSARLCPEMTSTTARGRLRFSSTGPCSMWNSRYPIALRRACASGIRFGSRPKPRIASRIVRARLSPTIEQSGVECSGKRPAAEEWRRRSALLPRRKSRRPRWQMGIACCPSISTSADAKHDAEHAVECPGIRHRVEVGTDEEAWAEASGFGEKPADRRLECFRWRQLARSCPRAPSSRPAPCAPRASAWTGMSASWPLRSSDSFASCRHQPMTSRACSIERHEPR